MNKRIALAWILVALMGVLIAVSRMHAFDEPIERDNALYSIIARQIAQGDPLYTKLAENKPPAIFIVYGAAQALLGVGPWAIYVLGLLPALLTLTGIFVACRLLTQQLSLCVWASVFWMLVNGDLLTQANQPNTEVFVNAAVVWAFVLLLQIIQATKRPRIAALIIGILLGFGSLFKTVVIIHAAGFAAALLLWPRQVPRRQRWIHAAVSMASAGAVWTGVFAYFQWQHRLEDLLDIVFRFNKTYAGGIFINLLVGLKPGMFWPREIWSMTPLLIAAAVGFVRWRRFESRDVCLLILMAATPMAVALPGKFYPHYYQYWLPVLCIAAAWGVMREKNASLVLAVVAVVLAVYQVPTWFFSPTECTLRKYPGEYGHRILEERPTAMKIKSLLREDETFYHWGVESGLYYYSGKRQSSIRFKWFLTNPPLAEVLTRKTLEELRSAPPEMLVTMADDRLQLNDDNAVYQWCKQNYVSLPESEQPKYFTLFYRRGGRLEREFALQAARPPGK